MSDLHPSEMKVMGLRAVLSVFAHRPAAIVRAYVHPDRMAQLRELLRELAGRRVAYHVVDSEELRRVAASDHHEGVVLLVKRRPLVGRDELLDLVARGSGPLTLLALDGVDNPHNIGAILRVAAHFGVPAVLLEAIEGDGLSSALVRTAEGGAELVDVAIVGELDQVLGRLAGLGFAIAATSSHARDSLFEARLPERIVFVVGGESQGVSEHILERATHRLAIPGCVAIESLNVATATAVLLAESFRRRSFQGDRDSA